MRQRIQQQQNKPKQTQLVQLQQIQPFQHNPVKVSPLHSVQHNRINNMLQIPLIHRNRLQIHNRNLPHSMQLKNRK